jgi:lysozyme family protein
MKSNFSACLSETLRFEGGWSDNRRDPGGKTMKGVTQRVYAAWRSIHGLPLQSVRLISDDELVSLYVTQYWLPVRGDDLPSGIDAVVFDAAVNSGPVRAAKWLQAALGVTQDGHIGAVTLDTARKADAALMAAAVCARRLAWLKGLKTYPTFGRGWSRRVRELKAFAAKLASKGI